MRDPNVECDVCKKLFCCAHCRDKHFVKQHAQLAKLRAAKRIASLECPICLHQPLPLQRSMDKSVLQHIEHEHLPLHCQKCSKVYESIAELRDFTACLHAQLKCSVPQDINGNETSSQLPLSTMTVSQNTIATQTSPPENTSIDKTPLFLMQQSSKCKHKDDFISDSVSSIKNLSSLSNISMRRSIDVITTTTTSRGKLVRTTSTPMQSDLMMAKPKEQTFNASSAQVSSIHHSEAERTPALSNINGSCSSPKKLDNLQKYRKIGSRTKVAAVTPLRQVMSKSIQKAFAEHGALPSAVVARGFNNERKKLIDSFECEMGNSSPLDLRVSPVVRRSRHLKSIEQRHHDNKPITLKLENISEMTANLESPPSYRQRAIKMSSQKISTESIVITRTQHLATRQKVNASNDSTNYESLAYSKNSDGGSSCSASLFRTCQSVEIITATKFSDLKKIKSLQVIENTTHNMTPISREPGTSIQKKLIHFETPTKETHQNDGDREENKSMAVNETKIMETSNADAFFTPESTPLTKNQLSSRSSSETRARKKLIVCRKLSGKFSPRRRPPIKLCSESETFNRIEKVDSEDDEVFEAAPTYQPEQAEVEGWSLGNLVSSVIALPTAIKSSVRERFNSTSEIKSTSKPDSILKRCASIASTIVRSNSLKNQVRSGKRKRIRTMDESQSMLLNNLNSTNFTSPEIVASLAKKFRIQPRPPLRFS